MDGSSCRFLAHRAPAAQIALIAGAALLASACTSAPHELPPRSKLNRYEIQSIEPEIRLHSECLAREIGPAGSASALASVRARSRCAPSLAQLRARLRDFNLSEDAQRRYLGALEIASRGPASIHPVRAGHGDILE